MAVAFQLHRRNAGKGDAHVGDHLRCGWLGPLRGPACGLGALECIGERRIHQKRLAGAAGVATRSKLDRHGGTEVEMREKDPPPRSPNGVRAERSRPGDS